MGRNQTALWSRSSSVRPDPIGDFGEIVVMSARPPLCFIAAVDHDLPDARGLLCQTRNPVDHVGDEVVAIEAVLSVR